MKRLIPLAVVAAAAIAVVVLSGCGSSKSATAASAVAPTAARPAIKTRTGSHGTYLVDGSGKTLYLFEADKPGVSNCSSACLSIWPALTANGKPPTVSGGVSAGKLGAAKAPDGTSLVTYNGHPLYYYAADQKPGDTTGQGLNQFGAKWYVLNRAGDKIDDD
jgi:predicted lipoprotein with Yx(FWY)xxD motif